MEKTMYTCPMHPEVQMVNPGDWVIHCHIPEHMEAGMMSEFQVN